MKEFIFYIVTLLLGGAVGSMVMCLLQIKNMKMVIFDREEEKDDEENS